MTRPRIALSTTARLTASWLAVILEAMRPKTRGRGWRFWGRGEDRQSSQISCFPFSCLTFSCQRKSDRKMADRKMGDRKMGDRKMADRKIGPSIHFVLYL